MRPHGALAYVVKWSLQQYSCGRLGPTHCKLRVQVGLALDLQCVLLSDIFTQVNNVLIINTYFIIHHVFDFTNMGENEQVDTSGV